MHHYGANKVVGRLTFAEPPAFRPEVNLVPLNINGQDIFSRTMTEKSTIQGRAANLTRAMKRVKGAFFMIAVVSAGINLSMLAAPIYMTQVYDRVLSTRNMDTLILLTLIIGSAVLVMGILEALRKSMLSRVGSWLDREITGDALASGVTSALQGKGATIQPLRDLSSVRGYLSGGGVTPLFDIPFTPIFMVLVFFIHPMLGITAMIGGAILLVIGILNEIGTRKVTQDANAQQIKTMSLADAAVRNSDVVAAMGMGAVVSDRLRNDFSEATKLNERSSDLGGIFAAAAKCVRMALQIAMLAVGAILVLNQEISPGVMIASSILMSRALAPIEQSLQGWKALISARDAYSRLKEGLAMAAPELPGMSLPRPVGRLEVEGVTFQPEGAHAPILNDINFSLEPGEALALIGPTGSGKSTLARLLVGSTHANAGSVRLDAANVADWDPNDRGRHFGYLPQDIELFPGTVKENIARMQDASDEEIIEAAQLADVHDMILRLPNGYDTQIGPGGLALSGGQRQRIALARAVFRTPRFLVLDEPNSNLDQNGDQALSNAIAKLKEAGSTVVLIAHRMNILSQMDNILVLKDGSVQKFGPRAEVLAALRTPAAGQDNKKRAVSQNGRPQIAVQAASGAGASNDTPARAVRRPNPIAKRRANLAAAE